MLFIQNKGLMCQYLLIKNPNSVHFVDKKFPIWPDSFSQSGQENPFQVMLVPVSATVSVNMSIKWIVVIYFVTYF